MTRIWMVVDRRSNLPARVDRPRGLRFRWQPFSFLAVAFGLYFLGVESALGQGAAWPDYPFNQPHTIPRGSGGYLSPIKLGLLWILFLMWVKAVDWTSQDCQRNGIDYVLWTPIVFFPFLVALLLLALTIPLFAVGFGISALAIIGPLTAYIVARNQKLEPHERVMTPAHIRHVISEQMGRAGIKISSERKAPHEKGAPVEFRASGESEQLAQANLISARQTPGYVPAKALVASAIDHRAEKVMLDYSQNGVTSRFQVDGVWHDSDSREREEGDQILTALKQLSDLNFEERRKRQEGKFFAEYNGKKLNGVLVTQGTKGGERVLLSLNKPKVPFDSLEELGMREAMIASLKELMLEDKGIQMFAAMPSGGLTTTLNVSLRSTDRLLRDFVSVEEKNEPMPEVENVDTSFYDPAAGESPATYL